MDTTMEQAPAVLWSLPPAISSSGARVSLWKSTVVGACGLKLARPAWNSTWSGHRPGLSPGQQGDLVLLAGGELHDLIADLDVDRLGRAGACAEPQVVLGQLDVDPVATVVDAEPELLDRWWQRRVEAEHRPAGPHAGQAAQHDV